MMGFRFLVFLGFTCVVEERVGLQGMIHEVPAFQKLLKSVSNSVSVYAFFDVFEHAAVVVVGLLWGVGAFGIPVSADDRQKSIEQAIGFTCGLLGRGKLDATLHFIGKIHAGLLGVFVAFPSGKGEFEKAQHTM